MGSTIDKINEDLEYYKDFCKFLEIKEDKDRWYEHFLNIIKATGNISKYDTYAKLEKRYKNNKEISEDGK